MKTEIMYNSWHFQPMSPSKDSIPARLWYSTNFSFILRKGFVLVWSLLITFWNNNTQNQYVVTMTINIDDDSQPKKEIVRKRFYLHGFTCISTWINVNSYGFLSGVIPHRWPYFNDALTHPRPWTKWRHFRLQTKTKPFLSIKLKFVEYQRRAGIESLLGDIGWKCQLLYIISVFILDKSVIWNYGYWST